MLLREIIDSRTGTGRTNDGKRGHLIVLKKREGRKGKEKEKHTNTIIVKVTWESNERAHYNQSWGKKKSSNKLNKIVLDFNPKYKINIYELLLSE